jgi:hypothetical protein
MSGNQHASTKTDLLTMLAFARRQLEQAIELRRLGSVHADFTLADARYALQLYRARYNAAPASTRRRWACGK